MARFRSISAVFAMLALARFGSFVSADENEAEATEEEESPEEKIADYQSGANELAEKMAQLRKLVESRGDKFSSEEMEKIQNLEKMVEGMVGGVNNMVGGATANNAAADSEVKEFFTSCTVLAVRRAGQQRPSTTSALRRMADGKLTKQEASITELWRLATSCINRITDAELAKFKEGKLQVLPKDHSDAAKTKEMEAEVIKLEDAHWKLFQVAAKSIAGEREVVPPASNTYGMIAAVPLIGVFGLLAKKIFDMQKEKEGAKREKENKKANKKQK